MILVTGAAHGSLTWNADGSFSYTPNQNYNGSDSFTYQVSDGLRTSSATPGSIVSPSVSLKPG